MRPAVLLALALAACADETVSRYADPGPWRLVELDGVPFVERATISFPEPGRVAGTLPCNSFSARQTAPYPWFALEDVAVTEIACPALAAEARVLEALTSVTLAEAQGAVLILSDESGREVVFRR